MSLSSPLADPGFFGKDDFVPFFGQVEDVNDPKQSGRVKIRCIGWHPKEKKDLPTDDLPWARVGMPTTHAQIGRVGGKHGLLPGSWVMGFFIDGHDAQNPFVLSSMNATSNSTEQPNTKAPVGNKGKLDDTDRAYGKVTGSQAIKNPGHRMLDEIETKTPNSESDRSGDNPTSNALTPCEGGDKPRQNQADFNNTETENGPDTQTSLNYSVSLADGKCGASSHAGERIQTILKELFPNDNARFAFNDVVYSSITGSRIDLNAIINLVSILICDVLKDSIENLRGLINETIQRPARSTAILGATRREYFPVKIVDQISKASIDTVNKVTTEIINSLCDIIRDLLQSLNNQTQPGQGNNQGGSIGADPLTPIGNIGALCVTELILTNVLTLVSSLISSALGFSLTQGIEIAGLLQDLIDDFDDGDIDNIVGSIQDILGVLNIDLEAVDQVGDIISFITQFKFTLYPLLFNTLGLITLDIFNLDECNDDGTFNTSLGALKSIVGGGGVGSTLEDFLPRGGFGGLPPGSNTGTFSTQVCDEALGTKIPGVDFPQTSCRSDAITVSVPSSQQSAAQNYINGIANAVVIKNPGCELFFGRGDQILFDISNLFPPDDVL